MKNIFRLTFALLLCVVAAPAAPSAAAVLPTTTIVAPATPLAGGAVIDDLAGPSDYGAATPAAKYDPATLTAGDLRQGYTDDCYFVAAMEAIVLQRPAYFSHIFQIEPDGTADVTLVKNGVQTIYRESPAINTWWGNPYTSYDDSNGNAAGDIILKAFARQRTAGGTMAGISWGLPGEGFADLGLTTGNLPMTVASFAAAYRKGDGVVWDTGAFVPARMVPDHSYVMCGVDLAAMTVTLRSPWGDGYADYDEYVTLNDADLRAYGVIGQYGQFGGDAPPAPAPEPATITIATASIALIHRRKLCR